MKKLVSVNIEGDKHLERVRPFLAEENPDIICMQEVFREDIPKIVGTEYQIEYTPMCLQARLDGTMAERGIAIMTRTPAWRVFREYYFQPTTTLVPADDTNEHTKRKTYWHGVLGVTVQDESTDLTIFTTHFTWTPNGLSNEFQSRDMERLLFLMSEQGPHILCGDFNLPRAQNSLYPIIASHYTDNVPKEYETSMFLPLHRIKDDPIEGPRISQFMVDYIFSTPGAYQVKNFDMRGNVSDHYALVADIARG